MENKIEMIRTDYNYKKKLLEYIREKYLKLINDLGFNDYNLEQFTIAMLDKCDYNEFLNLCSFIYHDGILHHDYSDSTIEERKHYNNSIELLNKEATKYLGKDFVDVVHYIYNNARLSAGVMDNSSFDIYKVFCNIRPFDTYLCKAVISATKIIANYSNKMIIGREYDSESFLDLSTISYYMGGNVPHYVYIEKYGKVDYDKFNDKEYMNNINNKIEIESAKHNKEWVKFISYIKDKNYKTGADLVNYNLHSINKESEYED